MYVNISTDADALAVSDFAQFPPFASWDADEYASTIAKYMFLFKRDTCSSCLMLYGRIQAEMALRGMHACCSRL